MALPSLCCQIAYILNTFALTKYLLFKLLRRRPYRFWPKIMATMARYLKKVQIYNMYTCQLLSIQTPNICYFSGTPPPQIWESSPNNIYFSLSFLCIYICIGIFIASLPYFIFKQVSVCVFLSHLCYIIGTLQCKFLLISKNTNYKYDRVYTLTKSKLFK